VASVATYSFPFHSFSIVSLTKFALLVVARLVRHTDARSLFLNFTGRHASFLVRIFASLHCLSREDPHSSPVFSPHLVVCREDSHSSRASSPRLIPRDYPHFPHLETYTRKRAAAA